MDIILEPLLIVLNVALKIYWYVVLATIIVSWLVAFNVINSYNNVVRTIMDVLARLTEPVLRPLRRILPDFGPVDLSPIALWLIILFLQMVIGKLLMAVHGL